ncbi:GDSL-type esterase/lipase family protein [Campylobacter sp. CCS1377]|uniref:GDSL-type esterase/lipase family protein n=1 Tax=Campylobacter sp. CCS1377 TaxID=3158229 RepID=A0AAU7E921_9BACT
MKNINLLIFIFYIFSLSACANASNFKAEQILNTKSNLHNFTSDEKLQNFKEKFQKKQDLKIRIFGDSHIAADFFSGELRNLIFQNNSIGFTYPLQPEYHQNTNLSYKNKGFIILNSKNNDKNISYPLGGIIAQAQKKDAYIELNTKLNNKFKIGILFKSPNTDKAFQINDAKKQNFILQSPMAQKWTYKELENVSFPLKIQALQKNVSLGGYFIYKQYNNNFIDILGINGASSTLWLRWNEKTLKHELKILNNDFIMLVYGSNDILLPGFSKANFKKNYKKLIQILKENNPRAIITLVTPPTLAKKDEKNSLLKQKFKEAKNAIYELAKEEELLVFDTNEFIEQSGGKNVWIKHDLSLKDVHLTIQGYKMMANKFYKDLKALLK